MVENRQESGRLWANLLHIVPEALLNKAHLPRAKLFGHRAPVGAKNRDPRPSGNVVLPFVGIRMPVHFAKPADFQLLHYRRHGRLNGKFLDRYDALLAAGEHQRPARTKAKFVWRLVLADVAISEL